MTEIEEANQRIKYLEANLVYIIASLNNLIKAYAEWRDSGQDLEKPFVDPPK